MKKIVLVGEIYSSNLGDGVIYKCMTELFSSDTISIIPLDLSLRIDDKAIKPTHKKSIIS